MKDRMRRSCFVALAFSCFLLPSVSQAQEVYIAGTQPDQRPVNAPIIVTFNKNATWYGNALHGVSRPYPQSLEFLRDQGAWFNPFTRPGMVGYYDIRGWYNWDGGSQ